MTNIRRQCAAISDETKRCSRRGWCHSGKPLGNLGFTDTEAVFNMRGWLQKACEAAGAKVTGAGFGGGSADLDLKIDGCEYAVSIRAILR